MQAHSSLGDRDAVRRYYDVCCVLLNDALQTEPSPETRALYQRLMQDSPVSSHKPGNASDTLSPVETSPRWLADRPLDLPMLGREDEWMHLESELHRAFSGRGGCVLVFGSAGIGKTRLITEFIDQRMRQPTGGPRPIRPLVRRCYDLESGVPYTMWADALAELSGDDWQPFMAGVPAVWQRQLARLLPGLASQETDIDGAAEEGRLRLHQGIVQCLLHLTRHCLPLLFFDDLHWADEASLELLHYAIRHLSGRPLLIIGAYRSEAIADSRHLKILVQRLSGTPTIRELKLAPLSQDSVQELTGLAASELSPELVHRLYEHSEGSPLVLVETLQLLLESGEWGAADSSAGTGLPLSPRVQAIIESRLTALSAEQHQVLAAAAVIGHPFDLSLLQRVCDRSELELSHLLEPLTARSFLRYLPDLSGISRPAASSC